MGVQCGHGQCRLSCRPSGRTGIIKQGLLMMYGSARLVWSKGRWQRVK